MGGQHSKFNRSFWKDVDLEDFGKESPLDVNMARRIFAHFDVDRNGVLDAEEAPKFILTYLRATKKDKSHISSELCACFW